MYYSTGILSKIMPTSAVWISLMITIINAAMTFPAIALIEVRLHDDKVINMQIIVIYSNLGDFLYSDCQQPDPLPLYCLRVLVSISISRGSLALQ